ncbi:MAG: acyl-CoA dehydratase activase [Candidatus Omnitrophota bacterium]
MDKFSLGIDVGSTTVKMVLLDGKNGIQRSAYLYACGRPLEILHVSLKELLSEIPPEEIIRTGITGSGGNLAAELLGISPVNELVAQTKAVAMYYPNAKTVIEMGGQDSKLLVLENTESGEVSLVDFVMNSLCAAGTGSFLDQQASRLNLEIEDFARVALESKTPARISGRCSVFAKSDMIHLQQTGIPKKDIVAGLCFAVARNFKSTLGKGKKLKTPAIFQGGVAANHGMVKAFREVLGLKDNELILPEHFRYMSAIGAGLLANKSEIKLEKIENLLRQPAGGRKSRLESLRKPGRVAIRELSGAAAQNNEKIPVYVGVDVGSVTTKAAILDENLCVLRSIYMKTEGDPINAVRIALKKVSEGIADNLEVKGAGTTGSGRILLGRFIGADVVRNEITAQATASIAIDKSVDTIFEIGGQDSKYISIDNGVVVDFEMNKACAAGTGSFLEEQAIKLDIDVAKEFANTAFSCDRPCSLGERCTVFMESDLVSHQQKGAKTNELVAGLAYSIAENYLNKVVADRKVGKRIFFQGGVAFNEAVVAALENIVKKKIIVPPHNEVTGAIGAALLAKEAAGGRSKFIGFDLSSRNYGISVFECKSCPNNCELSKVALDNETFYFGARCEKYEKQGSGFRVQGSDKIDLFGERDKLINEPHTAHRTPHTAKIGIPRVLHFFELMPLWNKFFGELGFEIVHSDYTNPSLIRRSAEHASCETCFPIKLVHGHVLDLLDKGADFIFLPSIVNYEPLYEHSKESYMCPYIEAVPFILRASLDDERLKKEKLLSPLLYLMDDKVGERNVVEQMGRMLGVNTGAVKKAFLSAKKYLAGIEDKMEQRGKELLNALKPDEKVFVIVSRTYNGCDPGINIGIPKKLKELGKIAMPMDYLALNTKHQPFSNMFWCCGQRILNAANVIKQDPRLFGIYVTNFGCGPDAFMLHYFRSVMKGKPYLQIEVDEHSGDAGVLTRLEAFLDSLR